MRLKLILTACFVIFWIILTAFPMVNIAYGTGMVAVIQNEQHLYYKSRLGLMPPAYAGGTERVQRANAASLTFLNPYTAVSVSSWPNVLATGNLTGDLRSEVAIATDSYFDPQNDERLHIYGAQAGAWLTRTQRLVGGADPEAIVSADLNQDQRADVVVALTGDNALAVYTQTLGLGLSVPLTVPLLGGPDALASGDFNGDLMPDLAAIAPLSSTIHLWRSRAPGLVSLPFELPYPTGGYDALVVGDFNHDGFDDIAALRGAGFITHSVVVYLQTAGAFPISATLTPEVGGYLPHGMAVGDVNGDGLDDVVVTAGGNVPDAYLNVFLQGAGGLITTPITYPAFHLPSAVAIADVNHDGREDVVVAHDGWSTLSVYTQTISGTLSAYTAADLPFSDRYRPNALSVADLDGNGGLDVALVDRDHGLIVLTNTLSAPTAVISQPVEAAIVSPGMITITGATSTGTITVQVRLRGLTNWITAARAGNTWQVSVTLPAQERSWWVEARAINAQGLVQAAVARRRIGVENGPSQGQIIINAGAYSTNQPTVTLTLPATDPSGVVAMRFTPDNVLFTEWITYSVNYTWTFQAGDGVKALYVQFKDGTGKVSAAVSDTIVLDTVPPTSTVAPLPALSTLPQLDLNWNGGDTTSGVAYFDIQMKDGLTGTWGSLLDQTSALTTTIQVQHGHTYCFRSRATDRAGNIENWPAGDGDTCTTIQVESGLPRGQISINAGAYSTNQPTVTLTLSATAASSVAAMRFAVNNVLYTEWITYQTGYIWMLTAGDGVKTVGAQFKDGLGNVSLPVSDTILLDTLPPTSTIASLPATVAQLRLSLGWSGGDTGSGLAYYDIQMKDGVTGTWSSMLDQTSALSTTLQVQAGHTYCFRSRATDRAGNVEDWPVGNGDTCTTITTRLYLPLIANNH